MDFLGNLLGKKQAPEAPGPEPNPDLSQYINYGPSGEAQVGPGYKEAEAKYYKDHDEWKRKKDAYDAWLRTQVSRGGSRRRLRSRKQRKNKRLSRRR